LWHKSLPGGFYATDLDLVFVGKRPPGIVAMIDYKTPYDRVTFSEVLAYNDLIAKGYPVFIIESLEPFEKFTIREYLGGDWKPDPPIVNLKTVLDGVGIKEFIRWEQELRRGN